jgi:type I restriction enzyme M protein
VDVRRDYPIFFAVSERSGKDSKGKPVYRPGVTSDRPLWDRLDHDLAEVVAGFDEFRRSEK